MALSYWNCLLVGSLWICHSQLGKRTLLLGLVPHLSQSHYLFEVQIFFSYLLHTWKYWKFNLLNLYSETFTLGSKVHFSFQARPILRDKDRLEEIVDPSLGGKYPKEDFVRVCTIAAACVAPEANQRPTMGEVVQSLKMVQRVTEYHDSLLASSNTRANLRQSSSTFEFDGTSSVFSSGPYSGISAFENDNISRTVVFSEDLCEGR